MIPTVGTHTAFEN